MIYVEKNIKHASLLVTGRNLWKSNCYISREWKFTYKIFVYLCSVEWKILSFHDLFFLMINKDYNCKQLNIQWYMSEEWNEVKKRPRQCFDYSET